MSIAGFGSLLSIDSARSTFPDLRNFRVRQVRASSCLSLCTCCMHVHVQRQTHLHVVACMLTLEQCWLAVLQLLMNAAGRWLPACVCAHGADILPARHCTAGHNGDQQPQLRGGGRPLHRGVRLRRALQPCHGRGKLRSRPAAPSATQVLCSQHEKPSALLHTIIRQQRQRTECAGSLLCS
jgi:hypothetical protein